VMSDECKECKVLRDKNQRLLEALRCALGQDKVRDGDIEQAWERTSLYAEMAEKEILLETENQRLREEVQTVTKSRDHYMAELNRHPLYTPTTQETRHERRVRGGGC